MVAGLLVDACRGCGQFIVKTIEQDAFASGDQAFHIWSPEVEVPDLGIFELVIPVAYPRQRRIHYDPSGHLRRVERCEGISDHIADVVGNESNSLNPELVENAGEIPSLSGLFVA